MTCYAIFDCDANLVDSFDTQQEAHDALAHIVAAEPDAADDYALITYDDRGHAVGEAVTGADCAAHA